MGYSAQSGLLYSFPLSEEEAKKERKKMDKTEKLQIISGMAAGTNFLVSCGVGLVTGSWAVFVLLAGGLLAVQTGVTAYYWFKAP
jgi:hypothetical protein